MTSKALLVPVAVLCLAAGAARADDRPSMAVRTSDLDLSSPKDVQRLYDRVYEAATVVCGGGPLVFFVVGPPPEYLACRDATVDATLARLNAPLVVDLRSRLKGAAPAGEATKGQALPPG